MGRIVNGSSAVGVVASDRRAQALQIIAQHEREVRHLGVRHALGQRGGASAPQEEAPSDGKDCARDLHHLGARQWANTGTPVDPEGSWPQKMEAHNELKQMDIERGGATMASGKTDELKGRVKEAAGALTGDKKLKREGKTDQAVGKVKQQAEKIIDKVKDTIKH
jgi:uncharacterized protein YjbJ (UPF0337 family)